SKSVYWNSKTLSLYKTELIRPRKPWRTIEEVELATAEWGDGFNHRRLYEYCGDIRPSNWRRPTTLDTRDQPLAELSNQRVSGLTGRFKQRWTLWLGYGCWRRSVSVSSVTVVSTASHPAEPHAGSVSSKLNWLRAGVLGANDGIVSTAGIVVAVAAATVARGPILTAGIAGLAAGAVSMALGEYVSVSTQRDTEQALLSKERGELREDPAAELDELAALYEAKGLSTAAARTVAEELTDHDAFAAHAEVELGIDPDDLTNPWQAALSSALSFTVGALLPLIAILLPPTTVRIPVTVAAVLVALVVTGAVSASLGGAPKQRAITRNIIGGSLALGITYAIGHLVGAAIT
ncbi:MAG: vacuolar iron transporter family protein, partial [Mycobacterium sp.]|nr:vacuolar iron transporter family protein [Mycobacterium sp.]